MHIEATEEHVFLRLRTGSVSSSDHRTRVGHTRWLSTKDSSRVKLNDYGHMGKERDKRTKLKRTISADSKRGSVRGKVCVKDEQSFFFPIYSDSVVF